jgi:hypothetical protein
MQIYITLSTKAPIVKTQPNKIKNKHSSQWGKGGKRRKKMNFKTRVKTK